MKRPVGLDLNGRFDLAARDWLADGEEEETSATRAMRIIRGGTAASVVVTLENRRVAGPQAASAPHGRGDGWGSVIGSAERRRPLAQAVDRLDPNGNDREDLRAARQVLARGADSVVAAVPDHPGFDETAQAGLIAALSLPRSPARLLWRPVAAFLDLMERGLVDRALTERRYRILIHTGAGIEDQTLTLRADPDHVGHTAPQRDGPGRLHPVAGLDDLFARADARVRENNRGLPWDRCEASRLGPRLVTGEQRPGATEVLRLRNGGWVLARAPALSANELGLAGLDLPAAEDEAAATFLCTPLSLPLARSLARTLSHRLGRVTLVGPKAVARGCLRAARLIERGLPHYFDRLEPIAIAVLRGDQPAFEHLIPPGAIVPANREHVSPELDEFRWGRGKRVTEFYVLKGRDEIRHWRAEKDDAPDRDVPVALRIRQMPGQSWARLTVGSQVWEPLQRSPVALDWEALAPSDLTPEQVLDKLRYPPPPVPNPIVERAHLDLWLGAKWAGDGRPAEMARAEIRGQPVPVARWVEVLRRPRRHPDPPRERFWLVGTDGSLPPGLPAEVQDGFIRALERMAAEAQAATLRWPPPDNSVLLALTWCFARCPEPVQGAILDTLEAHAAGRPHPLLSPRHAVRVLHQGAGRAVTGTARLKRLFAYLNEAAFNNDTINALAMALSRREEAPEALTRALTDRFLDRLGQELIVQLKKKGLNTRFRNTLSAIAGLFRWRKREPHAFLAAQDPVADRLRAALVQAQMLLEANANVRQRQQKLDQIAAIIQYLDGAGDPDILRMLEADDDEDQEDQTDP